MSKEFPKGFYEALGASNARFRRASTYADYIVNMLSGMIEYTGAKDNNFKFSTLSRFSMANGVAGVVECTDKNSVSYGRPTSCFVHFGGLLNENKISEKCICQGRDFSFETKTEKVALLLNNYTLTPETNIRFVADELAEIDTSLHTLCRNAKSSPIPVVENDTRRAEMEQALARSQRGEDITVLVNPLTNPLIQTGTATPENYKILHLTDPATAEKIHYLSEYHEQLIKRIAGIYGMSFGNSAKSAQISVDEFSAMDNYSFILPEIRLELAKEFAEQAKAIFGWGGAENITYSKMWKVNEEQTTEKEGDQNANPEAAEKNTDS